MKSCRLFIVLSICLLFSFSTPKTKAQSGAGDRNLLLPGATPEQAGQALDKILQNLAGASQVELVRKTVLPGQKFPENLTKVTIQLDANCNFDQLVSFLGAIKGYEKFLRVEELFIQSQRFQGENRTRPMLKVSGFVEHAPNDSGAQAQSLEKKVGAAEANLFWRDQNLELLRELAIRLPAETYLTLYRNQDCKLMLNGQSPPTSTSDLIPRLEESPLIKDVVFATRTFTNAQTGNDIFQLSAKCEK